MIFAHFVTNVNEANAFLAACEETRQALLVDAGELDPRIEKFLEQHGLTLSAVFITHDHYDHTGGLRSILDRYEGVVVYSGHGQAGGIVTNAVRHGDSFRVGNIECRVVSTPGHTSDGVSLILPGMVFTGDALFSGSVGGTFSPSDARRQLDALRGNVFTLPDDYEIHTGHGPSSTVRIEKTFNPFFLP